MITECSRTIGSLGYKTFVPLASVVEAQPTLRLRSVLRLRLLKTYKPELRSGWRGGDVFWSKHAEPGTWNPQPETWNSWSTNPSTPFQKTLIPN